MKKLLLSMILAGFASASWISIQLPGIIIGTDGGMRFNDYYYYYDEPPPPPPPRYKRYHRPPPPPPPHHKKVVRNKKPAKPAPRGNQRPRR